MRSDVKEMNSKRWKDPIFRQKMIAIFSRPRSAETREKMRIALKNRPPMSEATKNKIRDSVTKFFAENTISEVTRTKMKKPRHSFRGESHPNWKGNAVSYRALHQWVERELGKPRTCERCGKTGDKQKIHWANKSREYKREVSDWIRLCVSCHRNYDLRKITI